MTAEKGAASGTVTTLKGWSIYEVNITLKVTFSVFLDIGSNILWWIDIYKFLFLIIIFYLLTNSTILLMLKNLEIYFKFNDIKIYWLLKLDTNS